MPLSEEPSFTEVFTWDEFLHEVSAYAREKWATWARLHGRPPRYVVMVDGFLNPDALTRALADLGIAHAPTKSSYLVFLDHERDVVHLKLAWSR